MRWPRRNRLTIVQRGAGCYNTDNLGALGGASRRILNVPAVERAALARGWDVRVVAFEGVLAEQDGAPPPPPAAEASDRSDRSDRTEEGEEEEKEEEEQTDKIRSGKTHPNSSNTKESISFDTRIESGVKS